MDRVDREQDHIRGRVLGARDRTDAALSMLERVLADGQAGALPERLCPLVADATSHLAEAACAVHELACAAGWETLGDWEASGAQRRQKNGGRQQCTGRRS